MKKVKISLLLTIAYFAITLCSCNNQTMSNTFSEETNSAAVCLTKENFDLVKNYISENGVQIKLYRSGLMSDTTVLSQQLFFDGKTLVLTDYKSYKKVIVINIFNRDNIPEYFVSNESEPCELSAYYSMLDTEKSVKARNDDWCKIVMGIKNNDPKTFIVDEKTALKIAQKDAQTAYRDLSIYKINAELKEGNWYIDYNISNPQMLGGGPHYIICSKSGSIMARRYEQ